MTISQYNSPPNFNDVLKDIKARILALELIQDIHIHAYTLATRPVETTPGVIVFVSDAAAGAQFQGWNGSTWVNLG